MASTISICNLALGLLGARQITDFPPGDTSTEAIVSQANYEDSRDATIEDREWTFCTLRGTLAPLASTPDHGYTYRFQIPPDTIRVLDASQRAFTNQPEDNLNWVREADKILAKVSALYIRYLYRETNPARYSPGFIQTCAARLASDMAIALTGSKDMKELMWNEYQSRLANAGVNDGQQGVNRRLRSTNLIRVRKGVTLFTVLGE